VFVQLAAPFVERDQAEDEVAAVHLFGEDR
jgi:hypothetical protein